MKPGAKQLFAAALAALSARGAGAVPPPLYLVFSADHHGALEDRAEGGAGTYGAIVARLRRRALREGARLLHVHAGDLYQGTAVVNRTKGAVVPAYLDALRFHFGVPGNHEWDYGAEAFYRLTESRAKIVSSNILGLRPVVRKRLVYRLGPAQRVGFLGYTLPGTPRRAPPGSTLGLEFLTGEALVPQAAALRARGVPALVLLTHTDRREAEELGVRLDADVVIGAHTNEVIPPRKLPGGRGWYAQSGCKFEHYGWMRLTFGPDGRVREVTGATPSLADRDLAPDPTATAAIEPYLEKIRGEMAAVVGRLTSQVTKGRWSRHAPLVAGIAYAIREASGAELAVINPQTVRLKSLGPGPVTRGELYEMTPYDNAIAVITLTGAALDAAFEDLVKGPFVPFKNGPGRHSSDYRGILQPAGFSARVDPDAPPGARVTLTDLAGRPLAPEKTFRVATSDYLAAGGDSYRGFADAPRRLLPGLVRDAFEARLGRLGDRAVEGPGRLDVLEDGPGESVRVPANSAPAGGRIPARASP